MGRTTKFAFFLRNMNYTYLSDDLTTLVPLIKFFPLQILAVYSIHREPIIFFMILSFCTFTFLHYSQLCNFKRTSTKRWLSLQEAGKRTVRVNNWEGRVCIISITLLSVASVTCGHSWSKNIKWEIP